MTSKAEIEKETPADRNLVEDLVARAFKTASTRNIQAPFKVPDEVFMARELAQGGLANTSGTVIYPKEFLEE